MERLDSLVGSIGDGRVALGRGLELRVGLDTIAAQRDCGGLLARGRVRRVVVVIALEQHLLLLLLRDLARVRTHDVVEDHLDFEHERRACR